MTTHPFKATSSAQYHIKNVNLLAALFSSLLLVSTLSGCSNNNEPQESPDSSSVYSTTDASAENEVSLSQNQFEDADLEKNNQEINNQELYEQGATEKESANEQFSTREKSIDLEWSKVDSGEVAVDPAEFNYPFALDSKPVLSQAQYSNISAEQAQVNLTLGMTSNEPLGKIIDQLGDSYLSHKFSETEGKLLVYTTSNVTPSSHDYVISNDFAKGLILPIEVLHGSNQQLSEQNSDTTFH